MSRQTKRQLAAGPKVPVTVAEWDVTPGLHEWIAGEIKRREEAVSALVGLGTCPDWGHCLPECSHEAPAKPAADVLRRCAADRKILAAHPRIEAPEAILPYLNAQPGFACETCHADDGVVRGGGNCATILALSEAYGLEPADRADVEVVRD
ncbi:hypothetical protein ACWD3J_13770 [Streptomyces sp. NPDC002755]